MVCGDLRPRNAACHRAYSCGVAGREVLVRAWNLLGLLDLAVTVTAGFLTSPSPLHSFDALNERITRIPARLGASVWRAARLASARGLTHRARPGEIAHRISPISA